MMKLVREGPQDFEFEHALPPGPYAHAIDVGWGDADPAQIAYTANIPAWGLRAIEAWIEACVGVGWYAMNLDLGVGTPFVEVSCSFRSPITPRCPLVIEVTVARLGQTSLTCALEGFQEGRLCFTGNMACVFVDAVAFKRIPVPPVMRANIHRFAGQQGRPFEDAGD